MFNLAMLASAAALCLMSGISLSSEILTGKGTGNTRADACLSAQADAKDWRVVNGLAKIIDYNCECEQVSELSPVLWTCLATIRIE